jgi:hypothetical protein
LAVAPRFPKHAFILGLLLPTGVFANPLLDSDARCTHSVGLDQTVQLRKPIAASPNAIQDMRKEYIDRFGKPSFETQVHDGVTLTWVTTEGSSIPLARNVTIQVVVGALHVTCGTAF